MSSPRHHPGSFVSSSASPPVAAPSRWAMLLIALPALIAGVAILAIAGLGTPIRSLHAASMLLAGVLALVGTLIGRFARGRRTAIAIAALALIGLAATLVEPSSGPLRWLSFGFLGLYMAPLVLPALLVAIAELSRDGLGAPSALTLIAAALLLALQPDASQVMALGVAVAVLCLAQRARSAWAWATLAASMLATTWAFRRSDPLEPVAHVEGVFALAFSHSMFAGLAVVASALALVAGLALFARRDRLWPLAVAAYYAILFACSAAGLTPAPLIGYGAGPMLGFGLLIAVSATGAAMRAPQPRATWSTMVNAEGDLPSRIDHAAQLRRAVAADIPGIWDVRYAVTENTLTPGRIGDEDVRAAIEDSGCGWVIEDAGRIVGFAIGHGGTGNVWAMFVDPDAQGRGHGARLHAAMLDWFRTRPLRTLWLTTGADTRARAFYDKHGWRCVGAAGENEVRYERDNAV